MTTWDAHNERRLSLQDVIDELAAERRRSLLPKGEPPLSAARNPDLDDDSLMLVSAAAADLAALVESISRRPDWGMVDRRLPVASIPHDVGNQAAAHGEGEREEQQEGWRA